MSTRVHFQTQTNTHTYTGKLADVLAAKYDVVARFNGGNNAGHTVVTPQGDKFAFHLLPCGLIYPHTKNILGHGCVVTVPAIFEEGNPLEKAGIQWKDRLFVSDRAHMLFQFHKEIDGIQEKNRGSSAIGTTKKGIGPCYASKASRTGIRIGDLKRFDDVFAPKLRNAVDIAKSQYGAENFTNYDVEKEIEDYRKYADQLGPMIVDGMRFINEAYDQGARIITEGANAVMLDLDYGTFPYVTSSTTSSGGIATGLGLSPDKIDCALGVIKAYTTRVGAGPFPTELTDDLAGGDRPRGAPGTEIGAHMQQVGAEIGVTTGRKRRCGWLDMVVVQYGHLVNGYKSINLTKLDVLDELDEVKIGVAYELRGERLPYGVMPSTLEDLADCKVIYETMPGWKTSIAHCRSFEELPEAAQNYVSRIEELARVPVSWIGVGVGRDDMAVKGFEL